MKYYTTDENGFIIDGDTLIGCNLEGEKNIVIPKGIKKIADNAFLYKPIESVIIPEGVEEIGKRAFMKCSLQSVVIPSSVKIIDEEAFSENQISYLKLNEGLKRIGKGAFSYNEITNLEIPNSVSRIYASAFECNKLTSIKFSKNITSIYFCVFARNENLKEIYIPENLKFEVNCFFLDNIEKVTLEVSDFERVLYSLEKLQNIIPKMKELNIIGYKLTIIDRIKLNKFLKNLNPNLKIKNTKSNNKTEEKIETREEAKEEIIADEEINKIISEIKQKLSLFDTDTKNDIENKINTLILEYKTKLSTTKPNLSFNEGISLKTETSFSLRNDLILQLSRINETLSSHTNLITFLEKLKDLEKLLTENELTFDTSGVPYKVSYIYSIYSKYKNKNILNEITELINNTKEEVSETISKPILEEITLKWESEKNLEKEFEDKVNVLFETTKKYHDIKEMLNGNTSFSLGEDISSLKEIINSLNSEDKLKYTKELEQIQNTISFKDCKKESIKELILEIRKRLKPLLETLSPLVKNNEILTDINTYLSDGELNPSKPIQGVVLEILDLVRKSKIPSSDQTKIENECKDTLSSWKEKIEKNELEETKSETLDNNIMLQINIMKDLYKIKFEALEYINELADYENKMKSI